MEFRPCIDIHNGKVKQIVGSTLKDAGDLAQENFVSEKDAAFYAKLYREYGLKGGHVILLNKEGSPFFEETKKQALSALWEYPGGLMIGGGITDENASEYLDAGASHVIVTSYLFEDGVLSFEKMQKLATAAGREHVVFDLSCKRFEDGYHIMSNRWQTKTDAVLNANLLKDLEKYCDEYLIHAVDVEGNAKGIETNLVESLASYDGNAITYAGGVHSLEDIRLLERIGQGRIHVTVGSALDLFGGNLSFHEICKIVSGQDGI